MPVAVYGLPTGGRGGPPPAALIQSAKSVLAADGVTTTLTALPQRGHLIMVVSSCEGSSSAATAVGWGVEAWTQGFYSPLSGMTVAVNFGIVTGTPATTGQTTMGSTLNVIVAEFANVRGSLLSAAFATGVVSIGRTPIQPGGAGVAIAVAGYRNGGANNPAFPAGWIPLETTNYDMRVAWNIGQSDLPIVWNSGSTSGYDHWNVGTITVR